MSDVFPANVIQWREVHGYESRHVRPLDGIKPQIIEAPYVNQRPVGCSTMRFSPRSIIPISLFSTLMRQGVLVQLVIQAIS